MIKLNQTKRQKIRRRVRAKISGTPERPRLSVFKSNKHISAQVVDDINGITLAAATSNNKEMIDQLKGKSGVERAQAVGKAIGEKAKEAGIETVVFDRAGYQYHGQVKALAEGAREAGLRF